MLSMSTNPFSESSQVIPPLNVNVVPPLEARDHMRGFPNAIIVLMKYGDYQCPQSGQADHMLKAVQQQLGEQLCFVFRHFPQPFHWCSLSGKSELRSATDGPIGNESVNLNKNASGDTKRTFYG